MILRFMLALGACLAASEAWMRRSRSSSVEADFLRYLNLGFHLAPTGDQDNHYRTWGTITEARTAVVAPALTRAAILQALRDRHVYAIPSSWWIRPTR